jgi:phosphoglycolate/pyridoxal phosphate phosphatase family enzyme
MQLSSESIPKFLNGIDTFLFDCDGVLWTGKQVLPGIVDTLKQLRTLGKRIFFVSNNSRTSRKDYVKKISSYGIQVVESEVFSSSFAAAAWLELKMPKGKQAYIIGGEGIAQELALVGIASRAVEEHCTIVNSSQECLDLIGYPNDIDDSIGAVVAGLDFSITYLKVAFALRQLQNNPECLFVATNMDDTLPCENSIELPGGGSMVQFLSYCARKAPDAIVGKPNQSFLDIIVSRNGLDRSRTCMVGDKLSTDIVFGKEGSLQTLLVYSGVTKKEDLTTSEIQPDYTMDILSDLFK